LKQLASAGTEQNGETLFTTWAAGARGQRLCRQVSVRREKTRLPNNVDYNYDDALSRFYKISALTGGQTDEQTNRNAVLVSRCA